MNDTVTVIISIASAVLALGSAAFSIFTYVRNVRHDRRRDTLDAFNRLQNESLDKLNKMRPEDVREIAEDTASDEYKTLSGYIARLEHFCAGVNLGIYDRKTVFELANGYLDSNTIRSRIDPIIEKKHRKAEKDYYENIHRLLAWMKDTDNRKKRKGEKQ